MRHGPLFGFAAALIAAGAARSQEPIYSGPQPGEKLPAFTVRGVFEPDAGKELDFVTSAGGKPLVLVFVHDVNRQSIALTRLLTTYTLKRSGDGLTTGVIWLSADPTEAESQLKRIRHALAPGAATGISLDGREGPGAYGLNRNVQLTILVGHHGRVAANFALVQPSLQVDLPRILAEIVKLVGGTPPSLKEIESMSAGGNASGQPPAPGAEQDLRSILRPMIQKEATRETVDEAARKVDELAARNEAVKKEIGRIASTIVESGKIANYGTERAQEHLRRWAREHGTGSRPADDGVRRVRL